MDQHQRFVAHQALARAVSLVGSQSRFERLTGVKQQNTSNWLRRKGVLPGEYVLAVEAVTGISRHELRPDLYPDERTPPDAALDRRESTDRGHARLVPAR